eukprot:scaffold220512_cov23-Tisochrysis_lutea.AAC.1
MEGGAGASIATAPGWREGRPQCAGQDERGARQRVPSQPGTTLVDTNWKKIEALTHRASKRDSWRNTRDAIT